MKKITSFLVILILLITCLSASTAANDIDKEVLQAQLSDEQGLSILGEIPIDVSVRCILSNYTSENTPDTFALDYYKAFFEDDHEVHAIINEFLGITTRVACDNGMLFVTVFQYHQDDERKTIDIFYGKPTSEYVININTGDIEKKSNFLWWQTP